MRKTDAVFLFCVVSFAGLFAARSVSQAVPLLSGGASSGSAAHGVAGQSREVDVTKLKQLIDRGTLSDHEAEFYEPIAKPARSGDGEEETSAPDAPVEHRPSHSRGNDREERLEVQ